MSLSKVQKVYKVARDYLTKDEARYLAVKFVELAESEKKLFIEEQEPAMRDEFSRRAKNDV
jgi:hypothetical protein|tara:strand:- start:201 stop:383 length:183 start_codon:yes stop_codon:yes gene_type:complete